MYVGIQIRELQTLLYLASVWYKEGLRHPFAAVIELPLYPRVEQETTHRRMPTDALKGFVAVSSGTVVPAWISSDTDTPLVELCGTGFLSERVFICRQGGWGGERAERKEELRSAVRWGFESSQKAKLQRASKGEAQAGAGFWSVF